MHSSLPARAVLLSALALLPVACQGNPFVGDASDEPETSQGAANETAGDSASSEPVAQADSDDRSRSVAGGRDADRVTLVVVQSLSVGPIRDEVVVSAKVQARTEVQVYPKLTNLPVISVLVDEGDLVESGQLLMTLYDRELQLSEQTAKVKLDETAKEVERAKHKLAEGRMRVSRAERQAEKTQADLERVADLVADGLINVQEVEDKRLAADTAEDDLELERFSLSDLQLAVDLTSIRAQQAQIDWQRARSDLGHTQVVSPLSGVVASRDVDVGELSSLSTAAFRMVDLSEPLLNLRVPQDALPRLSAGQHVDVRSVTNPDLRYQGVVRTVNPVLDQGTGTVHVIVDLVPAPGLVPGLFCEARIVTAARDSALLVDKRAVLYENDQPIFYALSEDGGSVRRVAFEAGASTANAIEVLASPDDAAMDAGLRVVVVGQESLKDGARVKVRETAY